MTAPIRQSVRLVDALNQIFALRLADSAAARTWLNRDGGWGRLAEWLATRLVEPDNEEETPS
jgi:hypothetical protein